MGNFLWASVAGNAILALATFMLYSTNVDLNVVKGQQDTQITGFVKTTAQYKQQVDQCVAGQKQLIASHKAQISGYQAASLRYMNENRERINGLLEERGRLEAVIKGVKRPEAHQEPVRRIEAIDTMVNSYISELQR